MNLCTLSGLYENSRTVTNMLRADRLAQQLQTIANDPVKCGKLAIALEALESHTRVAGMEELVSLTVK